MLLHSYWFLSVEAGKHQHVGRASQIERGRSGRSFVAHFLAPVALSPQLVRFKLLSFSPAATDPLRLRTQSPETL